MKIEKVEIRKFRNLKNCGFDLNGNTAFVGNNRLGKTNYLNAISWCLTGYDLFGNCKDLLNVPYEDLESLTDGDVCVDVLVKLESGSINRSVVYLKNSYSQKLAINGLDCKTLKEGEQQIDQLLGISNLVLSGNKDFNVRRFLINPLYFTQCKESAFREFIIKQLVNVDTSSVFDELPPAFKGLIENKPVELLSQDNDKAIKQVKKDIEYWKVIKDYFSKLHPNAEDLQVATNKLLELNINLGNLTDKSVAIDKYALELSKVLNNACKTAFNGIDIVLLEKGQGEDVWKNTCYVNSPLTNARMDYCSTSEAIISGCSFICSFINKYNDLPHLPLIFDEMETLDNDSIKAIISRTNTQLISACVKSGLDQIETRGF